MQTSEHDDLRVFVSIISIISQFTTKLCTGGNVFVRPICPPVARSGVELAIGSNFMTTHNGDCWEK